MKEVCPKEMYSLSEVLALTSQAWFAGFNSSTTKANGEENIISPDSLKHVCTTQVSLLLQDKLPNQIPE